MRVKIEEIQDKGLELNDPIPADVFAAAVEGAAGFKPKSVSKLKASFKKIAGRVLLKGSFEATVTAPCKRCVNDVDLVVPIAFELALVPEEKRARDDDDESTAGEDDGKAARAGTFSIDDVDSEPFDGKKIELDPIIREQLQLHLPVAVLCKDDCKGICAICGAELNEKECGCERKVVDIRLAKLKDIKLN